MKKPPTNKWSESFEPIDGVASGGTRGVIEWLDHYGHLRYPRGVGNGETIDISKLTLADDIVQQAIQSIQLLDANLEATTKKNFGESRLAQFDGEIGPATLELLQLDRCGEADYDEATRGNATGRGSWPVPGCNPKRPNRANEHSIRINIDSRRCPDEMRAYLPESLGYVVACHAEMGLHIEYIWDGEPSESEIAVTIEPMPGSVIGRNYFPQAGTCAQTIKGWIDSTYNPGPRKASVLWLHEQGGHGCGLQHTNGGVMNPSILNIWPLTWKGDPHESTVRRMFGGEPIDTKPTEPKPEPEQPTTPAGNMTGYIETVGGARIGVDQITAIQLQRTTGGIWGSW